MNKRIKYSLMELIYFDSLSVKIMTFLSMKYALTFLIIETIFIGSILSCKYLRQSYSIS